MAVFILLFPKFAPIEKNEGRVGLLGYLKGRVRCGNERSEGYGAVCETPPIPPLPDKPNKVQVDVLPGSPRKKE
ncbi:MAG: hypothetical protein A2428_17980 [Bdellovibrionales bacterium RIFOXYC1_FULL_54_43]|nr:MAG: hypothetical protein A2428_17980 [Bdellovibrionales bacterium RIFOXYC1_FULL_54_43]OFZ79711.1 MAG: hypothetical protein A2603_06170 [Bdellovibrionales bacterium RIFOXYD1_FULL_55_31]